jgi:diguanylate cyclase (GGDEF)-like protein
MPTPPSTPWSPELPRVLVVETKQRSADVLREVLIDAFPRQVVVRQADTLAGALEVLQTEDLDLVLLDPELPDAAGLEAVTRIEACTGAAIVVLVDGDDATRGLEAVRAGAQDYVPRHSLAGGASQDRLRSAVLRGRLREAERREARRTIGELNALPLLTWSVDRDLNLLRRQGSGGWPAARELAPGSPVEAFFGGLAPDVVRKRHRSACGGSRVRFDHEAGGRVYCCELAPSAPETGGGCIGLALDVTAERRRERHAVKAAEHLRLLFDEVGDVLWDWDLEEDRISFTPDLMGILGIEGDLSEPEEWLSLLVARDQDRFETEIAHLLEGTSRAFTIEVMARHVRRGTAWLRCKGTAVELRDGRPTRLLGSLSDITHQRQLEQRLRQDAMHDGLTGLANRSILEDRLRRAIRARGRLTTRPPAVFLLDLDGFKEINDRLGHERGDRVLVEVANTLEECVRSEDLVARLGGDEFVIFVAAIAGEEDGQALGNRLLRHLRERVEVEGRPVQGSLGWTPIGDDVDSVEELLRRADQAMYRAKKAGKGRCLRHVDETPPSARLRSLGPIGAVPGPLPALHRTLYDLRTHRPIASVMAEEPQTQPPAGPGALVERLVNSTRELRAFMGPGPLPGRLHVPLEDDPELVARVLEELAELDGLELAAEIEGARRGHLGRLLETVAAAHEHGATLWIRGYDLAQIPLSDLASIGVDGVKLDDALLVDATHDPQARRKVEGLARYGRTCKVSLAPTGLTSRHEAELVARCGFTLGEGSDHLFDDARAASA